MIITLGHLRAELFSLLKSAGIERPEWEARQILKDGASLADTQILLGSGMYMAEDTAERLLSLARRRASGEPLAYVLGRWEIFGLDMEITPDVLIPREDTGVLIGICLEYAADRENLRILDLCCGSGLVGVALAKLIPSARVTLADISRSALAVTKINARKNLGGDDRVIIMEADALADPSPRLGRFDIICCNPPYISDGEWETLDPSVRDFEPSLALRGGPDGLDFYRAVISRWGAALRPGGLLAFETGFDQSEKVRVLMDGAGFLQTAIYEDAQGHGRAAAGQTDKGDDTNGG